jgi:hypothetical protein
VAVAKHIEQFVKNGGIVVADCVPQLDENQQPLNVMNQLFDVSKSETGRIVQEGQWVPFTTLPMKRSFPPPEGQEKRAIQIDTSKEMHLGNPFSLRQ